MTIDTSALVAIVRAEPASQRCLDLMLVASSRRVSAGNLLEAYLVIDGGRDPALSAKLDSLIEELRLVVEPVTHEHVQIARDAFHRYGKGSGHGASLNYGDCFAYAIARLRDELLLFVGNDFAKTDIVQAT